MISSSGTDGIPGDTEAAALIVGETLLSRDDIPDENQQTHCFSCGETMTGLFCHSCGQKNDDFRRSIWSLFSETFASVFSLENRMWRTCLMLLFKPGLVAREYADGQRTNWTSPVRIYLALSIILFGYMSLTETRIFSFRTDIVPKQGFVGEIETLEDASVTLDTHVGFFQRQAELDRLNSGVDFERVVRLMRGTPRQIFEFDDNLTLFGGLPSDDLLKSSQSWPNDNEIETGESAADDLRNEALETYTGKIDDIVDSYNDILSLMKNPETAASRLIQADATQTPSNISNEIRAGSSNEFKQRTREALSVLDQELQTLGLTRADIHKLPIGSRRGFGIGSNVTIMRRPLSETDIQKLGAEIIRNPAKVNEGISKYLPRIMFLMMPFAAIIGLIFIRGKKTALLYDHLVHAAYIHAVTFAFLFVLILISQWTPLSGMINIFLLGIAIYLPLSAKMMFKRRWFKTILASYTISVLYGMTMFLIVTFLLAGSIVGALNLGQA